MKKKQSRKHGIVSLNMADVELRTLAKAATLGAMYGGSLKSSLAQMQNIPRAIRPESMRALHARQCTEARWKRIVTEMLTKQGESLARRIDADVLLGTLQRKTDIQTRIHDEVTIISTRSKQP